MNILVVCVLGCAMMVLAGAAVAGPTAGKNDTVIGELIKRTCHCSSGWTRINSRYFRFFSTPMIWAAAEKYCQIIGGNLASVHNIIEYHGIQRLIQSSGHCLPTTWIGGSDAQNEGYWFWSDGTRFLYTNWCHGEPNNFKGQQHCLQMNFGNTKCWDDFQCNTALPFVCVWRQR